MEEFCINVELKSRITCIQVEPVPPGSWYASGFPQFLLEFHNGRGFVNLTLQLENGTWYDRNTRLSEDDFHLRFFELGPDDAWNPDYQSPFSPAELKAMGQAISNYMAVYLGNYLGYFIQQLTRPGLN